MDAPNKIDNIAPEKRQVGRPKGAVNKTTALLKEAILAAAEAAGGEGGTIGYLTLQAQENPNAFMSLLGKVLPLQVGGTGEDGAITFKIVTGVPRANRG